MDTQTRHALKKDRLVEATRTSVDWFEENRSRVITAAIAAVICLAIVVAGLVLYGKRSAAAELAFGEAMDTYNAPSGPAGTATHSRRKDICHSCGTGEVGQPAVWTSRRPVRLI